MNILNAVNLKLRIKKFEIITESKLKSYSAVVNLRNIYISQLVKTVLKNSTNDYLSLFIKKKQLLRI